MTWNYRVMHHTKGEEEWWGIHEVYYDVNGEVDGWTKDVIPFIVEDISDIKEEAARYMAALDKEILEYKD